MAKRSRTSATSGTKTSGRRRVLVITGSRSEFGLLRPVMEAIRKHKKLELLVAIAGEHLLPPAHTWKEVDAAYRIDAKVPMQARSDKGRLDHAAATARGMAGFAKAYKKLKPDWVVVLGDRIEAFAAASAASIAGIAVCHIHGGDRAEGIADEAMRHAITKLAHLHCAATKLSANRIVQMGERKEHVHVTGSPAIDGLDKIKPMSDAEAERLGNPRVIVLLHPTGGSATEENNLAVLASCVSIFLGDGLYMAPNSDPGREPIVRQWQFMERVNQQRTVSHLERSVFISLLKRLARMDRGAVVGNSSAGLLECAALGVPAINLGRRQEGRETARNVFTIQKVPDSASDYDRTLIRARRHIDRFHCVTDNSHPFGDGRAGPRIAALLAKVDPHDPGLIRKRNSY